MSRTTPQHPILLVHPDSTEADCLRRGLRAGGVARPIVIMPGPEEARDYLLAAAVASSLDARYVPCAVLLDEGLGQADVRRLAEWIHRHAALAGLHLIRLSDEPRAGRSTGEWGTDEAVSKCDNLVPLRAVIARSCESARVASGR